MIDTEPDYQVVLAEDPGNPLFADLAEELRAKQNWFDAIQVCLSGLSSNPSCARGRLVLAQIYFDQGYLPFARREVAELVASHPQLSSLRRLWEQLGGGLMHEGSELSSLDIGDGKIVAETEIDLGEIDLTED